MLTWNIIRAAGIGAYLMLWASVTWGLISTTSVFGKRASKATTVALHQAFSTSGLLLLATHIIVLVFDSFMPFSWLDVIVPLRSSFRPVGVALGIGAMFVTLLGVLSTSWGRKVIGTKWWRRTHSLSVPAFALALMHGLMTGTDTSRPGMFWMYVASAGILLFLLLLRALTAGQRPQRTPVPHGVTRIASNLPPRAVEGSPPVPEKVASPV
jgi:methionine sulfoxide reductase heme-binding subunit